MNREEGERKKKLINDKNCLFAYILIELVLLLAILVILFKRKQEKN